VVTGTAAGSGVKKLEAGYAITTLNADTLEQMAPNTTSEVLNAVPGIGLKAPVDQPRQMSSCAVFRAPATRHS
jgi:hypothetical protein